MFKSGSSHGAFWSTTRDELQAALVSFFLAPKRLTLVRYHFSALQSSRVNRRTELQMDSSAPASTLRWGVIGTTTFRLAVCIATVTAITVVEYAVHVTPTAAALSFLIPILIVSTIWGIPYAIFLSVISDVTFDYVFLPPFGSLNPSDSREWVALCVFLATGIFASQLANRMRNEALKANQRRTEAVTEQQRFRDLVNSVEGVVWEADAETFGFSFVSDQAKRILGYPTQKWLSEPAFWRDHLHPEDRDWAVQFCKQATSENRSHDFEYRMIAADGRVVWMRDLVTLVFEDGRATRLRGVMIDVTIRKENEQALREQAKLLDLTHDAIFVRNLNGVITYWNRGAEALYGWPAEQVSGKITHELLKTIFPEPLEQINEQVMSTGRWEGELVHTKNDGTTVVVASRWSLQRNHKDGPGAILETNNDISDAKRGEQARGEIEEQSRAAFESNPTMYFIVDSRGAILNVNTFGAEQLGYSVDELVGQPVLNVFFEPDKEAVWQNATACLSNAGRMMRWEARKIRKDGSMIWVRETANAVLLKKQPVLLVVCENITEQKRAEEAARRSEKELVDLIETIPVMVFSIRPDGSTKFVSRNWQDYAGLSVEATTGAGWQDTLHPDDIGAHLNKWRASLATGQLFENEVRHRNASGEYRWFLVRAVPLRDQQGNILKWYGILTDIEDRKRAEALLTGEKRILEMVAKGDSLAQILDNLCRLVEEQARGVLASVLLVQGDRLRHGGAPSLPEAYTNAIDGVVIGPAVGSCGTAAYRRQQVIVEDIATDPLWADYREAALPHSLRSCWSTPIFSSQGEVMATFAMYYREPRRPNLRDQDIIEQITHLAEVAIERKLTQEALRRSEAYLAEAQRLSKTGSWAWDPRTDKLLYSSEELYRMFDIAPAGGVPRIELFRQRVHPEDRERVTADGVRTIDDRTEHTLEYKLLLPDGAIKYVLSEERLIFDGAGELVEVIGTVIDVTERKRAEAEIDRLRQLEADLARTNRITTMGELTASLAHEINQPIAAAVTNANTSVRWLAGEPPDVDEAREAARRAAKDATRAAEIVNRIRALFKKGDAQREWVDVNEIIDELVVLLRNEAMRCNVSIHRQLSADLPQVIADRVQLQQVLMNLMVNGMDAMKGAAGTRELTLVSQRAGSDQVMVSVSDNGVGLPIEAGRIFNAFFTTKPNGTGMGLAISRTIIESHGGRLWASSNSDRGATFHFTLPTEIEARA